MENNNSTKIMWGAVALVAIIGLILISRKNVEAPVVSDIESPATTTAPIVAPIVTPAPTSGSTKAITTPRRPASNVIEYTSSGFKPFTIEVKRGQSLEFVNMSNKAMVIKSDDTRPENFYPGFAQESGPLGKGGKFYFAFTKAGAWSYYNLNNKADRGVIIVK